MVNRSRPAPAWVVWALLVAWLAGVLYLCLIAAHWLFGVPWRPVLAPAGTFLLALSLCGFSAFLIGCCIYQIRDSLAERRPVTWRGKLVGWVVAPTPDGSGGQTGRWLPANSPEAAEFLAALGGSAVPVLVGGVPARVEARPDESGQTALRWCVGPRDAGPPAAAAR